MGRWKRSEFGEGGKVKNYGVWMDHKTRWGRWMAEIAWEGVLPDLNKSV